MLLTVEYEDRVIEIHFDEEGAGVLINSISRLKRHSSRQHDHLMTPAWSGWELTEERLDPEAELINKVNLRFWPSETERA